MYNAMAIATISIAIFVIFMAELDRSNSAHAATGFPAETHNRSMRSRRLHRRAAIGSLANTGARCDLLLPSTAFPAPLIGGYMLFVIVHRRTIASVHGSQSLLSCPQ